MTHNDLIERVAQAMAKEDPFIMQMMTRREAHDLARAALAEVYAALREPTPEMVDTATEAAWNERPWRSCEPWRTAPEPQKQLWRECTEAGLKKHIAASPLNPEN